MAGILDIEAGRAAVCAATASLTGITGSVFAVASAELGPFFRQVDDLSRQLEAARVAILPKPWPAGSELVAVDLQAAGRGLAGEDQDRCRRRLADGRLHDGAVCPELGGVV